MSNEKQKLTKEEKLHLTRGLIYKIYSLDKPEIIYIGSTSASLKDRLDNHRRSYNRWKKDNNKGYLASYKIFENSENIVIEKLDKLYFDDRADLLRLEGKYQRKFDCVNIVQNNDELPVYNYLRYTNNVTNVPNEENIFKEFMYNPSDVTTDNRF